MKSSSNTSVYIRSKLFNIFFISSIAIMGSSFLPLLIFGYKGVYCAARLWALYTKFTLRFICNLKMEVRGIDNLPRNDGYIIASKHQSSLETMMFYLILNDPIVVLKEGLEKIPLLGLYWKVSKMIFIDRAGGVRAIRSMILQAKERLREGKNIIIFPEGTRTVAGEKNTKYHSGIAMMYSQLNCPVVPVALNTGVFWSNGGYFVDKKPGTYVIEILPPIQPGMERKAFMEHLQDTIESASIKLYEEAKKQTNDK